MILKLGSPLLTFLLSGTVAWSAQLTETFTTTSMKAEDGAVWNYELGKVHPTLKVTNWQVNNGDPPDSSDILVGDGSDGPFIPETFSQFGSVNGQTITIDASGGKILKVSKFHLPNNYTLTATGGPLVIYSLSTVEIDGTILCSGADASGPTPGVGRCGGGHGGEGGAALASGLRGQPQTGSVNAGHGGAYNGLAHGAGGGGGGAYSLDPGLAGTDSNTPPTNIGGAGGQSTPDHAFTTPGGGAGGGGGSGSNAEAGGGGGGGGGMVIIHAVGGITVSSTGMILAHGGKGGDSNTGGGGGGGGGGSIRLMTAGRITLETGTPVDVTGGTGGAVVSANAGAGGSGGFGRTWLVYSTFGGTGSESHTTALWDPGVFQYSTGLPEKIVSKSYDTRSTLPAFDGVEVSPSSTGVTFRVAGSNDNFVSDDTGWLDLTQLSQLNHKRFVRFEMTITNTNPTTPTEVTGVSINFTPGVKNDFNFSSGCGSVGGFPMGTNGASLALILLLQLLPLGMVIYLRGAGEKRSKPNSRITSAA